MEQKQLEQAFFDKVAGHLLRQRQVSGIWEPRGSHTELTCLYRGLNGLACAIGAIIPDHLYTPEMEVGDIYQLLREFPVLEAYIPNHLLAKALQELHDSEPVEYWPHLLRMVAGDHGLSPHVVEAHNQLTSCLKEAEQSAGTIVTGSGPNVESQCLIA